MPQPALPDRRHSQTSVDDLRRRLIEADAERFRLHSMLAQRAERPRRPPIRRAVAAMTALILTAAAGGLAWQMCTRPAGAAAIVPPSGTALRIQTAVVVPKIVRDTRMTETHARPSSRLVVVKKHDAPHPRTAVARSSVPRPLSPGEFGRKAEDAQD